MTEFIQLYPDCVLATHGHKSDADVLRKFIGSEAAYIGMIGSKAKVSQMKTLFLESGWATVEQWNRVYSPVGLDISGVKVLPMNAKAVLIFLGDQPFISEKVVPDVVEAWKSSGKGIVIPLFEGKRGHPPLYDLKYRIELSNLDPEVGLRSVARKFHEDIMEMETFCPEIVRDIDTPDDYAHELGSG